MLGTYLEKQKEKVVLVDVNYHFIYVMKRKEGAVTQYYILPEFEYNNYRENFVSDVEATRMKNFFSDSRKLYTKENKGDVNEKIVGINTSLGQQYVKMLTRYYAVRVNSNGAEWLSNDVLGHYFYRTVDKNGTRNYLSGMYSDETMAEGHKNFLKDCGAEGLSLVLVTPEGIKTLTE